MLKTVLALFACCAVINAVSITVQPESNSWWMQLKVLPPGSAKTVTVSWGTISALAAVPKWDIAKQIFTSKLPQALQADALFSANVLLVSGKTETYSLKFTAGSTAGAVPTVPDPVNLPGLVISKPWYYAYATHYDAIAAGTPVCGFNTKYCGAPSDQIPGLADACQVGSGVCQNCAKGYCFSPACRAPTCKSPTGGQNKACNAQLKIWCIDSTPGACTTFQPIVMTINNICPKTHPCNTCKGTANPCARKDHFDLCDATFFAIAAKQPSTMGLRIAYQRV